MSFFFPFLNFFQPGTLFPSLADYKPMLIASSIGLLVGLFAKSDYPRKFIFSHRIFICLCIFIVVQVVSLYYGGLSIMAVEFSYWDVYLLFVIVSVLLMRNPKSLQLYVMGMIMGSMFVVVYGLLAVFEKWPAAIGGRAGAYGMYENHNDYSFIIVQIFPFLYMYRRVLKGFFIRTFLGLAMLVCMLGMAMSLSRGGMLVLVLEIMLIVLFAMKGTSRVLIFPLIVAVGVAAIVVQFKMRAENQGDNYTASDAENSRLELWQAAGNILKDRPLLGVGSRRFAEFKQMYAEISYDNRGKNSHNTYLEVLTGTGFLGFIPFMLMLFGLIGILRRAPRQTGPPILETTRIATLISLISIMFRAILDAKAHDWSFYTLCAIGLSCFALQRHLSSTNPKAGAGLQDSAINLPNQLPSYR